MQPEVDAAQDAESYEWLWNDSPVYARAVEAAIRNGARRNRYAPVLAARLRERPERAARLEQAARHYAAQRQEAGQ
jgi:hypothetical protein